MENYELFADKIADLCHQYFENIIPAKGKPQLGKEWTVLSAFVKENSLNSVIGAVENVLNSLEVVAVGTGTKCLGQGEESADGDLVHDSHAEVVAKRSFVLYLVSVIS
jgi:tRNA-specific adenosine deaminase 1